MSHFAVSLQILLPAQTKEDPVLFALLGPVASPKEHSDSELEVLFIRDEEAAKMFCQNPDTIMISRILSPTHLTVCSRNGAQVKLD